jgi:hypothetical protein
MIRLAFICILFALSGCANLYAGIARYTVRPFKSGNEWVCCEAQVTSGKNAGSVAVHVTKTGENFTFDLTEDAVNSSASISAATAAVSDVSKAVSDTAITVGKITGKLP